MQDIILADIIIEYWKPGIRKNGNKTFKTLTRKDDITLKEVVITPPVEFYYKKWMKDKYGIEEPAKIVKIIPIKVIGYTNY
jgi:hypothetical protein